MTMKDQHPSSSPGPSDMKILRERHLPPPDRPEIKSRLQNPFALKGEDGYFWLKGNLHAHTTNSDGNKSPIELARMYREAGYDFLAITDHNRITRLAPQDAPEGLTLIPGVELHPENSRGGQVHHFLCLGVNEDIDALNLPAQKVLDAVATQGGQAWLAHPHWSSVTLTRDVMHLGGLSGLEVYNGTCSHTGRGMGAVHWDEWMGLGQKLLPALAVDDCHFASGRGRDNFLGWVMVRVKERSAEAILEALARGAFYASSGPELKHIELTRDKAMPPGQPGYRASVTCSPARAVVGVTEVYGNSRQADGPPLEQAEFDLIPGSRWVRFEVHDRAGRMAWSNPLALPLRV